MITAVPADLAVRDQFVLDPATAMIAGLLLVTEYPPFPSVMMSDHTVQILRVVAFGVYLSGRNGNVIVTSAYIDCPRPSRIVIRAIPEDFPVIVNILLEVFVTVAILELLLVATYPPFPSVIVRMIVFPTSVDHQEIIA